MNNSFKKAIVTGLTLAMVMGGSTSVFADSKGKDNKNDREWKKAFQNNGNNGKNNNKNNNSSDKDIYVNNLNVKNLIIRLSFDDVKGGDVEWAARYIASLASKRVFEGYEDGTFQPRKTISRIDAIAAAVRLMGLRDEAESAEAKHTNLNFKDADKVKDWAKGYVAVALKNDLFSESDDKVQPDKEADRLWATTLLVKALKKQDEAKAKMSTKLTFKDADKIPAGSVGYVAVAIEQNLIDGYEDNTFRPNQPVTRAEMAKLLDRTGVSLPNDTDFNGTLNASVSNNTLTLTEDGQTYSIELASDVYIIRNGYRVNASELRAGDKVRVSVANNQAIYIEATGSGTNNNQLPQNSTFTATVNSVVNNNNWISLTKDGRTYNVEIASNAYFERGGVSVSASALRVGDQASVTTSNGKVSRVIVTNATTDNQLPQNGIFTASINSAVNNNVLSVTKDNRTYNVELASNPSIERNGVNVAASELRAGDQVRITMVGGKAKVLIVTNGVQSTYSINGTYNSIDTYSNGDIYRISINRTLDDGTVQNNVYVDTVSNVAFLYATSTGTIQGDRSQLRVGGQVELRINSNDDKVNTVVIK
ncbi:S-layer homology domain-containing protein [Paenibacillus piri]|uniref:S-layer homology domain-containing protein n=1 Tax=Paenibacillus piri TaxID=2547395 RepID=A0A4R5KP96_9BACL|nr:S-layer homology domain-containing protein [Paenibacillus piri]TDF97529.1 S-layer homology domain-containing protein [Paenibacillus piri]